MRARSIVAGLATTAVAVSVTGLVSMAPASADPTYGTPDANDIVGVGSDTTENALDNLSNGATVNGVAIPGYNDGKAGTSALLASFDTVGSAQITLRSAGGDPTKYVINRPVGSGAGKALLYGAGDNANVTYARSSSALNTNEVNAGLEAFPFAVDTLGVAVSGVSTHAPAKLTGQQILGIYEGSITNWSQVGGSDGVIKPYIPQSGSGTRSFFDAQLALIKGSAVSYAASVDDSMHENTDDVLKDDPNAIAPFSLGKQQTLYGANGSIHQNTVRMESLDKDNGGWSAQRALYNVVRGTDLANSDVQAVFGGSGFICSAAARPLIEAAGFKQLATLANGGVCGEATQAATSNFASNQPNVTTTTLKTTGMKAGKGTLVAQVTGSTTAPSGTVSFFEGDTLLQADVPLTSGQATLQVSGTPGVHTYTADFSGEGLSDPSTATKAVYLKAPSSISESFPAKVAHGARAKGVVKVTLTGVAEKATGTVKVLAGTKALAKSKLVGGKVTITLPRLSTGKHALKVVWGGDAHGVAATKKFTITQK